MDIRQDTRLSLKQKQDKTKPSQVKASKNLYIYPLTNPTNLQPIIQSVGTVGDSKMVDLPLEAPFEKIVAKLVNGEPQGVFIDFPKTYPRSRSVLSQPTPA
tara:strand:- start:152 stop:454 length:303 start_codon:yes stop_codon:yes gene_type:complete